MGTPASKRKTADLSRMSEIAKNLRQANDDIRKMTAYRDGLVAQLQKAMKDAEVAKIDGVEAFTWGYTKSYAWAQFAQEHGDIADKYKITVEKRVLDTEGLLRDHPGLCAPFRSRQFLVKQ